VGYGLTFVFLGLCLKTLPLGTSYAIWAGVGTAAAAIGSLVLFHEKLSLLAIIGIAVIIVGVVLVTLSTEHG
jgi:multidrug transporter EmrE-like cation transporter